MPPSPCPVHYIVIGILDFPAVSIVEKKVSPVTHSISAHPANLLHSDKKIVVKRFGSYVVGQYFCTRIRERTAVVNMMNEGNPSRG